MTGSSLLTRLPHLEPGGGAYYRIGPREVEARPERNVRVSIDGVPPGTPGKEVTLPPCPDCGGTLRWAEAGSVPGARRCGGCGSIFTVETATPGRRVVARDVYLSAVTGETLRVGLLLGHEGQPESLVFALGHGRGEDWREDPAAGGVEIPAHALPALLRTLEYLQGVAEAVGAPEESRRGGAPCRT
jgi:hypothetical protein